MLLPGAKMQISFVKDLATMRDPRSEFTFLNYLHRQNRLVDFTNLGTFLPARAEYEDYMRWAASFFDPVVRYSNEVVSVKPNSTGKAVQTFSVETRDLNTGLTQSFRGRNILFATGGQPSLPKSFPQKHPRVIHSSQYAKVVPQLLPDSSAPVKVRPKSSTTYRSCIPTLKPASSCAKSSSGQATIRRLSIASSTRTTSITCSLEQPSIVTPCWQKRGPQITASCDWSSSRSCTSACMIIDADLVVAATGYQRTAHVDMLKGAWDLLPKAAPSQVEYRKGISGWNVDTEQGERNIAVGRNYQVKFNPGAVAEGSGVWLQGCCEGTHGLSDTLLSVLSTRSGEIVESIFGK